MNQLREIEWALILLLISLTSASENTRPYIQYSYRDSNDLGPLHWSELEDAERTKNNCKLDKVYVTPLNIQQGQASLPVRSKVEDDAKKPSLTAYINSGIEEIAWELGYPMDTYSGYEIRGPRMGLIQITDEYGDSSSLNYDFNCAFISYCDYWGSGVGENRSSHQIDGNRYPLEVNMLFFSEPRDIGIDMNYTPLNNSSKIIMISILGQMADADSESLEPVVKAAEEFNEMQKELNSNEKKAVRLSLPFSPTWLFPDSSSGSHYYYYKKGNFPVPSCFPIDAVYVFRDKIKISESQLDRLMGFRSQLSADKDEEIHCTHGVLRTNKSHQVYYNPFPFKLNGRDNKPVRLDSKAWRVVGGSCGLIACSVICLASRVYTLLS